MSAPATHRGPPPDVDEGDARDLPALLVRELRPTPGRLGDSVRIVVVVLCAVAIAETFRIPDVALSGYIVLFLSRREAVSTMLTALISGVVAILAIFTTIAVFMLTLSEPALRIPLMVLVTFGATFLSRAATPGPLLFSAGFIIVYGLTMGDEVLALALQPATNSNAPQFALPEIAFVPPAEALLHTLLWLNLSVAVPVGLLIAANLVTGRDPARLLRGALAERLATAAAFCAGEKGAERRLEGQAFAGTAELHKLHHLAGALGPRRPPLWKASLIDDIGRLGVLLLAWLRVAGSDCSPLLPAAAVCRSAERALLTGEAFSVEPAAIAATGAARPLADWISLTLHAIRATLAAPPVTTPPKQGAAARSPRRLLAADAFSNPEHVRFALKVTLAVMVCYAAENLADWPGISTCVPTCFMVALGTVAETLHKAMLRIVGCLIGAALGLGAILLLMPHMTSLGDLLLLLAPVTLLAAWVGYGSERIAYAGFQIGLAFYLVVLHGFGPTVDMSTAKDRVIGILLGNIVIFVIFTTIWPASVASIVRTGVGKALEQLAALVALGARPDGEISPAARSAAGVGMAQAIAQARAVLVNEPFETREVRRTAALRPIDAAIVDQVARLFIPVSMILDLRRDPAGHDLPQSTCDAICAYHRALEGWLRQAESWVCTGQGADRVSGSLPEPPVVSGPGEYPAALATWYGLLHRDIGKILDEIVPHRQRAITSSVGDTFLAAG